MNKKYSLDNYKPLIEEIVVTQHCLSYGENLKEPCWGKVIKDTLHTPNFKEDPVGTECYVCQGHYDCIEGGKYAGSTGL